MKDDINNIDNTNIKLDQHFLKNESLAEKIVSYLNIEKKDSILEIGPGKGILTKHLPEHSTIVELDNSLYKDLKEKFPNLKVINKNILKIRLDYDKIIGNIPYSISERLINKLIKVNFKLCILTVSENFLNKGLLSLITPYFFEIKTLETIKKENFEPVPKVNSKVISIKKIKLDVKSRLIKKVYLQSDKKLKNVINTDLEFKEKRIRELSFEEWKILVGSVV
jgi:16S rRNA (adenine1518-N6/adenine1519-N6)-dimethyltransferase